MGGATNAKADHRTQVPPKYKLAEVQTWKFEHKHKHKHKHKHGGSQKLGTARAPLGPHPGARNLLGFRPSHRAVTLGHHGASNTAGLVNAGNHVQLTKHDDADAKLCSRE